MARRLGVNECRVRSRSAAGRLSGAVSAAARAGVVPDRAALPGREAVAGGGHVDRGDVRRRPLSSVLRAAGSCRRRCCSGRSTPRRTASPRGRPTCPAVSCACLRKPRYDGTAIASRMPMMMMTTRSSMRVKPSLRASRCCRRFMWLAPWEANIGLLDIAGFGGRRPSPQWVICSSERVIAARRSGSSHRG